MRLKPICIVALAIVLICFANSGAVDIGSHTHGIHPDIAPVSLSEGISSGTAINYELIGLHVMNYQIGMPVPQYTSPRYYFGKDFQLGTIDNNYDVNFITEFLADP